MRGARPCTYAGPPGTGSASMWMPAMACCRPVSQVLGAPASAPSSHSSGYSPRFQTLPASSCAQSESSASASAPSWKSRSQTTTVSMPSTCLTMSVTVKTTRCVPWPCPRLAVPTKTSWWPGTSGRKGLSIVVGWEKCASEKTGSPSSGPSAAADARQRHDRGGHQRRRARPSECAGPSADRLAVGRPLRAHQPSSRTRGVACTEFLGCRPIGPSPVGKSYSGPAQAASGTLAAESRDGSDHRAQ